MDANDRMAIEDLFSGYAYRNDTRGRVGVQVPLRHGQAGQADSNGPVKVWSDHPRRGGDHRYRRVDVARPLAGAGVEGVSAWVIVARSGCAVRVRMAAPESVAERIPLVRAAALVYDPQVGILAHARERPVVLSPIGRVIDTARRAAVRVVSIRHVSAPPSLMVVGTLQTGIARQRVERAEDVQPTFRPDANHAQLVEALSVGAVLQIGIEPTACHAADARLAAAWARSPR